VVQVAIQNSAFTDVLFLDSDSFPVRDPEFLFDTPEYEQTGASE
jgi:alpha-N-acetylglucosamine transferase